MTKFNINIFLPAAGLGERLRPITEHLPKPLIPVLGRPLLELILEKVSPLSSGRIGMNLHFHPDMLRDWAAASVYGERMDFFFEDPILGTGGALKNAEGLLSDGPFLVHNADVLSSIDLSQLIATHLSSKNIATLATHNYTKFNTVVVDGKGRVIAVEGPEGSSPNHVTGVKKVAYTGIAVYSPDIFRFLPPGGSHVTDAWVAAVAAGHTVQAFDCNGSYWNDFGTPASYAAGVLDALQQKGETVYLSPSATCGNIEFGGYAVVEGSSTIEDEAWIRNCIVLPGARVSGPHENSIIGPDYTIDLGEADMQPGMNAREQKTVLLSSPLFSRFFGRHASPEPDQNDAAEAILIGMGGSERRYFRVRNGSRTAVLMECRPDDQDYERHLVYTRFFEQCAVPVPELFAADDARKSALFEDLGDVTLYAHLKLPRPAEQIEKLFNRVMDILVIFHSRATEQINDCPLLAGRLFDYDYLRWETDYFLEQFVIGLRKEGVENRKALEKDFDRLARTADAFPKGVIHRDFQCQNIMISRGGIPRVIDYQGARMAPAAYDLASILWDPYSRIDDVMRERLLGRYVQGMEASSEGRFDKNVLAESLVPCRLQRHMQALGAYGYLSSVKGKKQFLRHVPEALRLLKEETALAGNEYPALYNLIEKLA